MIKIEFSEPKDDGEGHWIIQVKKTITGEGVDPVIVDGIHVMPYDALEWRAAEYGIDSNDTDTLMDIILAEAFMSKDDYDPGTSLYEAQSVAQAREAHLARCARIKLRHRMSTRGKDHCLNKVKKECHMHPEAVKLKADLVKHNRENRPGKTKFADDENRIENLRQELGRRKKRHTNFRRDV